MVLINRRLGSERVYMPLFKVADTPLHIQGDVMMRYTYTHVIFYLLFAICHKIEIPLLYNK